MGLVGGIGFLDSGAQFLAVAEHRLIPARARYVGNQLRRAWYQSVWAPACQDQVAGGHAGLGVVSLEGVPLAVPTFATPEFKESFQLGRALRVTLTTGLGGVVHLFDFYGYREVRRSRKSFCLLTSFFRPSLLRPRWFVSVSLCSFLVISMLILALSLVWQVC